ncbi:hypothetical protein GO988_11345 [Hymenobacter sp. HMF4947]|uniref:Uncharacterized protein n=1 Tax=Hymenobacter ginkgonis TaxID=2682976 RepID=A0A7K1TET4_9BACT|nr:hypothetical protein [Hymenobacter ginkgonis]MVN76919.1 hypothetical protein [Hymenobacter ginkgonis]
MYRPAFAPSKLRLNYEKTWQTLTRLFKQPGLIKPAQRPEHLEEALASQKFKLPKIKGNVVHTMKEIVNIFIANYKKASGTINLAIKTTRRGLMKRGSNHDPKTAYRHILALIEYGFLRGKVQIKGGLQLLINPACLVFDASPAEAAAALAPSYPQAPAMPTVSPAEGLASLLAFASKSTQKRGKPS